MIDPYKFQPLRDGILVRELPVPPRPDGLIVILDNPDLVDVIAGTTDGSHNDYRRTSLECEVIAVGPGKYVKPDRGREFFRPTTIKPGDRVRCTAWNDLDGLLPAGFRLVQEADIWWKHEEKARTAKA